MLRANTCFTKSGPIGPLGLEHESGARGEGRGMEEWERRMLSHDVACVVATQTWGDYLFSEGFGGQRDFVTSFSHPALGKVDQSGQAVNLLRTPANLGVLQEPAAATATLLKELGYSPTEIKSLAEKKAVVLAKD